MGNGGKRTNRRRQRIIKPAFQLRVILLFLVVSALSAVLQSVLMSRSLSETELATVTEPQLFSLLRTNLLVTLAILVPATLILGVVTTFRIAGPIYRFERFLEAIAAGERPRDCQVRRRDELQGFCALLNEATAPLRHMPVDPPGEVGPGVDDVPGLTAPRPAQQRETRASG